MATEYFCTHDKHSLSKFIPAFSKLVSKCNTERRPVVILCIGTDRATGDCLGPIVGHKLSHLFGDKLSIYGTLANPVHAKNLEEITNEIQSNYKNPFIIAIDASLGSNSHIGYITLAKGPVKPGTGVNKNLTPVGDIHITGIVNISGFMDGIILQNTRLNIVMEIADFISTGISRAYANPQLLKGA